MKHFKYTISLYYRLLIFLVLYISPGCKKFIEIPPPGYQIISDKVFENEGTANSAVAGIYSSIMESENQLFSSGFTIYTSLYSDDLKTFNTGDYRGEFENSNITQTNHAILSSDFWSPAYKYIYTANLCIEKLAASKTLNPTVKASLTGEAKFVRAFCYFHLINLFGDVPLVTSTDYSINAILPRSNQKDIYELIIKDLDEAKSFLPEDYGEKDRTRPTKFAASAFLARIYLYTKNWNRAEGESDFVINSGHFKISENLNEVFLKDSKETIWQLEPVNKIWNTWEGKAFLFSDEAEPPQFYLHEGLLTSFEEGDRRKTNWTLTRNYLDNPVAVPYKYKIYGNNAPIAEYYTVLRLAEQYLIRSEARTMLGNLDRGKSDLNLIRQRAGLDNVIANNQEELLDKIRQERRHEFFAEWGHRWLDLKRVGLADQILKILKPDTWNSEHILWPIPINQINANPKLIQNPGY